METLRKILEQGETNGVAIGHFNISDLVTLKAMFETARDPNARSSSENPRENGSSWAFAKSLRW